MRRTTGARRLAGVARVNKRPRSASSASLAVLGLLVGLLSCASRVPLASSAENAANAGPQHDSAARLQNCPAGSADCDGKLTNTCEAILSSDPKNCGACGVRCAGANGESSCLDGTCRMVTCIPGHCDLDADPKNGCEAR